MNKETEFMSRMESETIPDVVPTARINFEEYNPNNIVVWEKYIPIADEEERLTKAILNAVDPYLIESEKGQGKTLLVHTVCSKNKIALIEEPVGVGTKRTDLIGTKEINRDGTLFNLGLLPKAIEVANHYKHACLYCDEGNAQDHEIQRYWNRICDGRKSIVANGKTYRLDKDAKLSIVWTINPVTYAGINSMTEDLRSRFVGSVWSYPTEEDFKKVINWKDIPVESAMQPLLTLIQDIYSLRLKGELEYALSIRDIAQFTNYLRYCKDLPTALNEVIMIKYGDASEREIVRIRINDTFGVKI